VIFGVVIVAKLLGAEIGLTGDDPPSIDEDNKKKKHDNAPNSSIGGGSPGSSPVSGF
jgi:hypothetical protein